MLFVTITVAHHSRNFKTNLDLLIFTKKFQDRKIIELIDVIT